MREYGESKMTRIMMATVPHVTSGLGLRKFQTDGFLSNTVYLTATANEIQWKIQSSSTCCRKYPSKLTALSKKILLHFLKDRYCITLCTRVILKVMSNFFLQANWEQQTKESMVVDGTSCCVTLECLVTSIACIT